MFLTVDRHPIHTAADVTRFAAAEGRLRLFYLPTHSPELNPDGWVWKNVKHDHVGRFGITSRGDLFEKATRALERLQKLPGIVRGFFRDPHLAYILA